MVRLRQAARGLACWNGQRAFVYSRGILAHHSPDASVFAASPTSSGARVVQRVRPPVVPLLLRSGSGSRSRGDLERCTFQRRRRDLNKVRRAVFLMRARRRHAHQRIILRSRSAGGFRADDDCRRKITAGGAASGEGMRSSCSRCLRTWCRWPAGLVRCSGTSIASSRT